MHKIMKKKSIWISGPETTSKMWSRIQNEDRNKIEKLKGWNAESTSISYHSTSPRVGLVWCTRCTSQNDYLDCTFIRRFECTACHLADVWVTTNYFSGPEKYFAAQPQQQRDIRWGTLYWHDSKTCEFPGRFGRMQMRWVYLPKWFALCIYATPVCVR